MTPLHWAVMCEQHQHIVTLLSSIPATNVNARDPKGRTALNYAVLLFSPICIKVKRNKVIIMIVVFPSQAILECSPAAVTFRDFKGRTALHYACAEGSADCIRALLACKRYFIKITAAYVYCHAAVTSTLVMILVLLLSIGQLLLINPTLFSYC